MDGVEVRVLRGTVVAPPGTEVAVTAVIDVSLADTDGTVVGEYENGGNDVMRHFQWQSAIVRHKYPLAHGQLACVPVQAGFVSVYDVG